MRAAYAAAVKVCVRGNGGWQGMGKWARSQAERAYMREMGARIRAAREERGWSRWELGAAVDLSYRAVSYYEQGTNAPTPFVLDRIAHALDVKLAWLMKCAGTRKGEQ
ncbi:MAG TPA: helix-turn-helix transcriptional regulator [Silvibacterium sp.]|nr:helix-turn-helix transcriptional regulator [Silvibacterium sp.]